MGARSAASSPSGQTGNVGWKLYSGDTINGVYRSWHANGRLAEHRHYVDGTDRGELFLNFEVRNGRHYGLTNSRPCVPVRGTL